MRFKVTIEYDGGAFLGWQRVSQGASVQGALEEAIFKATGERVEVQGAGGGGGGSATTSTGQASISSSGSAGTYAKVRYTSVSTQTVTIATGGAAGTGGASPTAGGTPSATSFGSLVSCPGGIGGAAGGDARPDPVAGSRDRGIPPGA